MSETNEKRHSHEWRAYEWDPGDMIWPHPGHKRRCEDCGLVQKLDWYDVVVHEPVSIGESR